METRWQSHENTWAGGARINRALRERDGALLEHLLQQNPGLLVRVFHQETRDHAYREWKAVQRGSLAHAVIDMGWIQALDALHAAGEGFTRIMAQTPGSVTTLACSPLAMAVRQGQLDTVQQILEWGAPATGSHLQPLVLDAMHIPTSERAVRTMVALLARHGAKADVLCLTPKYGVDDRRDEMPLWACLLRHHHGMGVAELLEQAKPDDKQWVSHEQLWFHWRYSYASHQARATAFCERPEQHLHRAMVLHDTLVAHGAPRMDPGYVAQLGALQPQPLNRRHAEEIAAMVRWQLGHAHYPTEDLAHVESVLGGLDLQPGKHDALCQLRADLAEQVLQLRSAESHAVVARPRL